MKTVSFSWRSFSLTSSLLGGLVLELPGTALGQDIVHIAGSVSFQNTEATLQGVASHLVTNLDGTLLIGTQCKAELYYLDTTTSLLTPIAASVSRFKSSTTSQPGTWAGPSPAIPLPAGYGGVDIYADGSGEANVDVGGIPGADGTGHYPVTLRVRVWDSTTGSDWESAAVKGESPSFTYTEHIHAAPLVSDNQMITQPGFQIQFVAPVAPSITTEPESQTVMAGTNVLLSVSVTGTPYLSYQWQFQGSDIPGATSASLLLSNVQLEASGIYTVTVTNSAGGTISDPATLTVLAAPSILVQPKGQMGYWGKAVSFSVVARGSRPLFYQWFKDGSALSGATGATLTLANLDTSAGGNYVVVVSNSVSSVTSSPALLLLNAANISMGLYPGLTIDGVAGNTYGIEYTTNVTDTASWITLTNLTLTQPVQLWVDTSADAMVGTVPHRSYRVVAVP